MSVYVESIGSGQVDPTPKFSILLRAGEHGPQPALKGVLSQSYPAYEVLILGRPGGEGLDRIAVSDDRVRWVGSPALGPAELWASGLTRARGEYVIPLAASDQVLPGWLETLASLAGDGSPSVLQIGALLVGSDGLVRGELFPPLSTRFRHRYSRLQPGTFALRRDLAHRVGSSPFGRGSVDFGRKLSRIHSVERRKWASRPTLLVRKLVPEQGLDSRPGRKPRRGEGGYELATIPSPGTHHGPPRFVSVIVPTLNGAEFLGEQLAALAAQDYTGGWEVIVADNGSTDGTLQVARSWTNRFGSWRVVDASARAGACHARNVAARLARGDLLVFTDHDDIVDTRWLTALARAAQTGDLVAGLLDTEALNSSIARAGRVGHGDMLPGSHAGGFLPYAAGSNIAIWRDVWEAIGGWNEAYTTGEDQDISWRGQLCGYGLGFARDAVVHYRYRTRLSALARQLWTYYSSGVLLYRDFRDAGAKGRSISRALKTWAWAMVHITDLFRGPELRRYWIRIAIRQMAFVRASIRYRVVHL